jgi:hypothetical protein
MARILAPVVPHGQSANRCLGKLKNKYLKTIFLIYDIWLWEGVSYTERSKYQTEMHLKHNRRARWQPYEKQLTTFGRLKKSPMKLSSLSHHHSNSPVLRSLFAFNTQCVTLSRPVLFFVVLPV